MFSFSVSRDNFHLKRPSEDLVEENNEMTELKTEEEVKPSTKHASQMWGSGVAWSDMMRAWFCVKHLA